MAKRVVALNDQTGKAFEITKTMQKSQKSAIPWTRGPQTRLQKFIRSAVH